MPRHPKYKSGDNLNGLIVLEKIPNNAHGLYRFQCKCEAIFTARSSDIAAGRQKSCGCGRRGIRPGNPPIRTNPNNWVGRRFGQLVVREMIVLESQLRSYSKIHWKCKCDCDNFTVRPVKHLKNTASAGRSYLHCGDLVRHPEGIGSKYPPMPVPMPEGVAALFAQYQQLAETGLKRNHQAIEDRKRELLLRACWIVHYRVGLGETLSSKWIKNYLGKSTAKASIFVWWQSKIMLRSSRHVQVLGSDVTELTHPTNPVRSDLGNILLSKKKIKFLRK